MIPDELAGICSRMAAIDPWLRLEISAEVLEAGARNDDLRRILVCDAGDAIAGCVAFRTTGCNEYLWRLGAGGVLSHHYRLRDDAGPGALPDGAYVNLLAVFPGHQGLGIGQGLLAAAENAAREAGGDRLYLCVSGFNSAARLFYERHGYQQIGILENCIRPGNNEHLMLRLL